MRLANVQTVRSIDWTRSGIAGTGSISPRARRTLAIYIVLAKMGFDGLRSPMGAIADAVCRAGTGAGGSIRTLQRSHMELEQRGFIRRGENRGDNRAAVIYFEKSAFAYWTGQKAQNVRPMCSSVVSRETMCEHVPHAPNCRSSDRTKITPRVNIPTSIQKNETKQRAGARATKKNRRNPVLFSVLMVLRSALDLHPRDRRSARARAEIESRSDGAGVELVNPSGVDWAYWSKRWEDMPIAIRETTVKREILPRLLGRHEPPPPLPDRVSGAAPPPPESCAEQLTAEQIRSVCEALEASVSVSSTSRPAAEETHDPRAYPEIDPTDPDMALLITARDRARARAVNGW